jgi:hypothetical protein
MTAVESAAEANEVREQILSDRSLRNRFTMDEIEQLAANRARDVFAMNMIAIAPTNMFEVSAIFNKTGLLRSLSGDALKASRKSQGLARKGGKVGEHLN